MARRVKAPLAACLACLAALALLVVLAYSVGPAERLDGRLLAHLAAHQETRLGTLAEGLVHLGDPLPLLVLLAAAVAIGLRFGRRRQALAAVVVVAGANVTSQVLKVLLAHPRPQLFLGPNQIASEALPSGHATAAASLAIAFALVVPAAWRPLTALFGAGFVAAVGCSVVVLDWHFPSDVAGGLLVAAAWGFAALAALAAFRPAASASAGGRSSGDCSVDPPMTGSTEQSPAALASLSPPGPPAAPPSP